jgi:deoxyribodipyrimidine photo-lyase
MSAPNRARFVLECLADLRAGLRARGGDLVVRSGRPEAEAIRLATQTGTQTVFVAGGVSRYAVRRPSKLPRKCSKPTPYAASP